jgi:hypothetical protein
MRSFQRIAELTNTTVDLITQLRELEELREQVRKAETSTPQLRRSSIEQRRPRLRDRPRSYGDGRIARTIPLPRV